MQKLRETLTALSCAPWNATVSSQVVDILQLPSLFKEMTDSSKNLLFDVAIIGGGIAGISAALSAAKMGARVILLEKADKLGAGASGLNAGILGAGVNMPIDFMPEEHPAKALWRSTSQLVHQIYEEAKEPESLLQTKQVGAFSLATTETAVARLENEAKARNDFGLSAQMVQTDVVQAICGGFLHTDDVKSALWLADEGRINPLSLLAQRARTARRYGAIIVGSANVRNWEQHNEHWQLNITASNNLGVGISLRAKSLVIATGPIEEANQRIYAISFAISLPNNFPLFWDAAPYIYYDYRYGDGYLTVSGGRYAKAGATKNDAVFHQKMIAATRKWLPFLNDEIPTNAWAVDLKVTNDMIPQINYFSKGLVGMKIEGLGALGVLPGMVLGSRAGVEALAKR